MKRTFARVAFALVPGIASSAAAQPADPVDPCDPGSDAATCICKGTLEPARYLPSVRDGALEVRAVLCDRQGDSRAVLEAFLSFVKGTVAGFDEFGGFVDTAGQRVDLGREVRNVVDAGKGVPTIARTTGDRPTLEINGRFLHVASESTCDARAAEAVAGSDCHDVLEELEVLYGFAQQTYGTEGARKFAAYATRLEGEWDEFLNGSRSQTLLELALNSCLYRRREPARFASPPSRQWVLLHPNVVLEHVDAANDGENVNEGLLLELVGLDWWRQDRWYVPSGGSVVALYSDRAAVADWGYGVALYFRSVYTLGAVSHSGEAGVFVSADLFKLFQDKKKLAGKYRTEGKAAVGRLAGGRVH